MSQKGAIQNPKCPVFNFFLFQQRKFLFLSNSGLYAYKVLNKNKTEFYRKQTKNAELYRIRERVYTRPWLW